jgi:hypothetical protein
MCPSLKRVPVHTELMRTFHRIETLLLFEVKERGCCVLFFKLRIHWGSPQWIPG